MNEILGQKKNGEQTSNDDIKSTRTGVFARMYHKDDARQENSEVA